MKPHVEYLGHRISAEGLQPTDTKVKALKDAPLPRNVSQLKSFLGLLNYSGKFVPNLSTHSPPSTCCSKRGLPGLGAQNNSMPSTRSFVWWPGTDKALEDKVKTCEHCRHSQHLPAMAPIQPWEWPECPWSRLHVDYAGPLRGHMFLVVVDAYSKWMEVRPVKSATSTATISQLRAIFATHGIPELLVSDNGSTFSSSEFEEFMRLNGIRCHRTWPPPGQELRGSFRPKDIFSPRRFCPRTKAPTPG